MARLHLNAFSLLKCIFRKKKLRACWRLCFNTVTRARLQNKQAVEKELVLTLPSAHWNAFVYPPQKKKILVILPLYLGFDFVFTPLHLCCQ